MQTCAVSQGTGTVANGNITTVAITCVTKTFAVGGTVAGLTGSGLVLQNNLGDNLTVADDGTFTFADPGRERQPVRRHRPDPALDARADLHDRERQRAHR